MTSRHYRLPSLNALATFEASARHLSLKRAADELNVTPGAVSRQIKALEEELGVRLFDRGKAGLSLTGEGETLYAALAGAFGMAAEAVERVRADPREARVTIACTHAFAERWLLPRMHDFWERHPDICVDHLISDDGRDFRRAEVDVRIRYGFGAWPDETSERVFADTIRPVAGAAFAARHAAHRAEEIAALPLLHVDWVDPDWTGWPEFLRRLRLSGSALRGRRFSSFDAAIHACRSNQGVALGWDRLLRDELATGAIVPFTSLSLPSPGAYYLTWNATRPPREAARVLVDWIAATAAADDEAAAA